MRLEIERIGELGRHGLDRDAEPSAHDAPVLLELREDLLQHPARDREPDRIRLRVDRGVDPNHLAREVEQRPARVAGIDRGVGLDEVVVGSLADVASGRAHDASRDGVIEAERVSDRDHPVAGQELVDRRAAAPRSPLGLRADQRDLGLRVGADHGRFGARAVLEHDVDPLDVGDDVVIGDDQARLGEHESRAEARHREWRGSPGWDRRTAARSAAEQSSEQIAERPEIGHVHRLLGVDVDDPRRDRAREDREARVRRRRPRPRGRVPPAQHRAVRSTRARGARNRLGWFRGAREGEPESC